MFFTVPQSHEVVIMRLGKFHKVKKAGFRFKLPIIDTFHKPTWGNVANKDGFHIEMAEQQLDPDQNRKVHTKDNVEVTVNCSIYWQIVDTKAACFEVDNLVKSLKDSALNALRDVVGEKLLDEVLGSKQAINEAVASTLRAKAELWGVTIRSVEIQEIDTNDATADAMRQEMVAERKKRALKLEAEGEKQAMELKAEGDGKYIDMLIEKLGQEAASQVLMTEKTMSAYAEISKSGSAVYLPANVNPIVHAG